MTIATLSNDNMMPDTFFTEGQDRSGPWLITCDHAGNHVPGAINGGNLGLPPSDMTRHIAYDIGAAGLARALAQHLDAPVIGSNVSRLVIDPNRGSDDPTLVMKLYDGTIIPANRHADASERQRRLTEYWQPYHDALEGLAARPGTLVCAVHSFTPRLRGRPARPWELGILSAHDRRLADPLIQIAKVALDSPVGDNEPYPGHLPGDSIDQHALRFGRPNVLLELRNDLIATAEGQKQWAERLGPMLEAAREKANL